MAKCSLKKSPNGVYGGYSQESIEELEGFVTTAFNEALMNAGDGSNGGLIKKAVRDALHKIGDLYSMNLLDKIAEITLKLIDNSEDLVFLNEYIPIEGIKNAINPKYRLTVKESNSSLGEPEEGETLAKKSQFLDDVWGNNVRLKNAYKQEVTNLLINKFIIDREHGRIVKNASDANLNIRDYKNELWQDIKLYLIGKGLLDEFTPDIYEDGEYTGVFEDEEVRKAIRVFGSWDTQKIQLNRDTDDYQIFKKWFTLKNFDNFTRMLLGKAIIIKPGTENTFSNEDNYSFATKNDAVITSWRTNEDVVLELEIGALAQSLINSTPYYLYKNDAKTDLYIKFSDFYLIITKLKDSVYNPVTSNITFSRLDSRYKNLSDSGLLTQHELDIIQGKSLKDLICSIRENPALYSKLLFTAIINDKDTLVRLNFTDEDLNKMYSLYKGIFAPNGNSIQTILAKEDYRALNYYNLITLVVDSINSVKFLLYNIEDGVVKTRLLKDYSAENVRRSIENNIAYINSSHILSSLFKEREAKLYNILTLADKANNFSGITCTIPNTGVTVTVDELGNSITYRDKSGKLLSPKEIENLVEDPQISESLWQFIDDNLAIGVSYDTDLRKALKMYSVDHTILDLLKLTSTVLLNKYIANVKGERSHGKAALNDLFDNIYKGYPNKPKYNSELMEMGLYSDAMTPILDNIAKAKALTSGIMLSASVKDADGKTLSQLTLSRLLGNLIPLYNWIKSYNWIGNDKVNPFSKMSLMLPGVFRGIYTTREVKSPYGNKPQTLFTVSEFSLSAFLYDFVDGFTTKKDVRGDVVIGNGKVGLLPSVNSDKNTINRMCVDLMLLVSSAHPELNGKQFIDLNSEELQKLTSELLGHYFKAVNLNIQKDFDKLFNWINGKYHLVIYSLEDINSRYSNPADLLYQWVKEYNDTHNDVILLIDLTHYSVDKKTKRLKSNMLLKGLETRFSDPSKLAKFMLWKETEVLKSLLDENVEIRLIDGTNSSAKTYLKDNYKDWVHNGKMVFAKVNGKDILTKLDLINLGLDINDPHSWNIELHPMLSKYNALDYFFTSQYMYAGVGCHTNHPSKADYNVPIIYKHPKLGLSTFLQNNPQATNYLMDFDDFFNEKRDAFIEALTGIEKSIPFSDDEGYVYYDTNPEWTKAKENYLILNLNNPEFLDFVKKAWNEAKLIAKELNKILLNSSSTVLKMFPQDFSKVLTMSLEEAVARGMDPDWKNTIDTALNGLIVPKIEFKSGEYFDKAFSSYLITKEMGKLLQNETEDEASRFAALHKRNVSYTAAMHEFQLNQIDGVPSVYNMAIMSDLKSDVYTVLADVDKATNFDGATFVNPFIVIWENNSLNGDKAGINKKQFVHFYDRATGTGGIIKTAGFGLTNDKIRQFDFYRNMMYNMTSKQWKNADGSQHIMRDGGILKDFEGNDIDYGDFYYRKGAKFYKRRILSYDGNNTYSILEQEVDENGEVKGNENTIQVLVNSNYDVWQIFGGMNSVDFLDGTLQGSEKSIEMTAHAANIYGTKKEGVIRAQTADDIILPMKHSDIHYMPTISAVKHGAANINPVSSFFNRKGLSFMLVEMRLAGILLDKEHQADNEDLSLMTLVISAACSMGYTKGEATNLYNALYSLSKLATKAFRDEMGDLLNGFSDSFNAAVTETIMKSLVNASATDGDMLLLVAKNIIKKINAEKQFSINKTNYADIDKEIPYSDAAVSAKVVSSLTSALTKAGIKTKMPGLLAVLNPAEGIIKMYKVPAKDKDGNTLLNEDGSTVYKYVTMDSIEKEYDTENAFEVMELLQAETQPLSYNTDETGLITSMPDVKIGRKYLVTFSDGVNKSTKVINVTLPHRVESDTSTVFYNNVPYQELTMGYRKLIDYLNGVVDPKTGVTSQITEVKEFLLGGQDLDSYDVKFLDSLGNRWQMSDLDIVQDYFEAREAKDPRRKVLEVLSKYDKDLKLKAAIIKEFNESNNSNKVLIVNGLNDNFNGIFLTETPMYKEFFLKYALKFLNREMQRQLAALNPENTEPLNVLINNKVVTVLPSTINITSYGTVIPKTAASSFGLNLYDLVSDIVNNPDFFLDRLAKRLNTKVLDYYKDGLLVYNYHLELKRNDGNHVYIRRGIDNSDFANEIQWFKYSDGNVFRVNSDGNIMHPMYSENDKIYTDYDGNEIIVTEAKDTWKDSKGNEVKNPDIKKIRGITIDLKTGEEIHLDSPFTFYLDNLNYNFVNLNANCSEAELLNLLDAARSSKSKKANNFAKRLAKIGDYDRLVDYLDKLTKYEDLIKGDTKNPAYLALQKESRLIWTSFMKYLENVAARIPAQSLLSFMAQRVAMFENTDTNNAYVSKFLFFLQGSDLDIDAVSIQTFDINRNGIYETYSPYANLDSPALLKASEKYLPFPTGEKIDLYLVFDPTLTTMHLLIAELHYNGKRLFGLANKLNLLDALFLINYTKNGNVTVEINTNSELNIKDLATIIKSLDGENWKYYENDTLNTSALASLLSTDAEIKLTVDLYDKIENGIIEAIDKHNTYLKNNSKAKNDRILKNFAVTSLLNIIKNPVNLREALSSVDVMTSTAKNLTKASPKNAVQKTFTPGNVFNKIQSINENMVGKDGIAICATGLKSFFALTHMYNTVLNDENTSNEEKEALMCKVTIGGKTYRGLANVNANLELMESLADTENGNFTTLLNYLLAQEWESDAANEASAFLSLSTDNAKELALAKLNAGTLTLGMYLYGLSLGVPVDTLFKIMTSPFAFRLVELAKGDIFSGNSGCGTIIGALDYLHRDPLDLLARFNTFDLSTYNEGKPKDLKILGPADFAWLLLLNSIIDDYNEKLPLLRLLAYKSNAILLIEDLRSKVNLISGVILTEDEFNLYSTLYNQALDFMELYIADIKLELDSGSYDTVYGKSIIATDLETLALGADEYKEIGKILRLNQEVKTNALDLQNLVANIEEVITRRLRQLARVENRGSYYSHGATKDELKNPDKYKIDLEKFLYDEVYLLEKIALYDRIKQSYNVLRVLTTDPLYKGYMETLYMAHQGLLNKLLKYRFTVGKIADFILKNKVTGNLLLLVLKNGNNYVDYKLRQNWMRDSNILITIPGSTDKMKTYAFIGTPNSYSLLYFDKTIQLGTDMGDANFKLWMEQTLIPRLKADPTLKDNIFILHLSPIVNSRTNLGMTAVYYGLNGINMLPLSDAEREMFDIHKDAFNRLATYDLIRDAKGNTFAIKDLFYLYSLICNNGKFGPTSLHKIFEDYLDSGLALSYKHFIAEKDRDLDFYQDLIKTCTDEWLAPMSSPYVGGSKVFKYKDLNNELIILYKKKEKKSKGGYDYDFELDMDDAFMNDMGFDPEGGKDPMAEINNYVKLQSSALAKRDYSFFSNPEIKYNAIGLLVMPTTLELTKLYPITYEIRDGKPVIVNMGGNKEVVDKFIKLMKARKGVLPTKQVLTDMGLDKEFTTVIDEKLIESELNSIINCE